MRPSTHSSTLMTSRSGKARRGGAPRSTGVGRCTRVPDMVRRTTASLSSSFRTGKSVLFCDDKDRCLISRTLTCGTLLAVDAHAHEAHGPAMPALKISSSFLQKTINHVLPLSMFSQVSTTSFRSFMMTLFSSRLTRPCRGTELFVRNGLASYGLHSVLASAILSDLRLFLPLKIISF